MDVTRTRRGLPTLIADPEALAGLADRFSKLQQLALDTEAASFHRYVDRVYLIQLSNADETALIDPLAVTDLGPLGRLLADRSIETIVHDADYDLRILNRDYGFQVRNIFDTRVAAQFAGEPSLGLGALLERHFKIKLNKKLQRADWSRRPLTQEMIKYAADDTRYLLDLRDKLKARLVETGRLPWAEEEFGRLERIRWTPQPENQESFLRIKGAKSLQRRPLALLQALHEWREGTAREQDRAPFRIMGNAALIAIATAAPQTQSQLAAVPGVPASAVRRYGGALVAAVKKGLAVPEGSLPTIKRAGRADHDPGYDRRLEALKQLRNRKARELNLEPGVLCPNATLQAIARAAPKTIKQLERIAELRRWQIDVLGSAEVLAAGRPETQ